MSTFSLQLRSITAVCLLLATGTSLADGLAIQRNATDGAPFSSSIWVGDQLYVAGMLPDDISGNTRAQTTSTLLAIKKVLQSQGLDMADVIQMRVYLLGDPALGGKMDFAAMNASYLEFFGTASQPNRPVRATVQVAGLARAGALVEIEVIAARKASR
ncbi:MAG: Rid family hydrolase [Proteobacteria bacterium]|nr:Rid family hydrolase [Pseudomonadota bacterium]